MSGARDEYDEMPDAMGVRRLADSQGAAGDDDVTRFLTELRALGDGPAPPPSPELAALLTGANPRFLRRAAARVAARVAVAAALVIGALVTAAADHRLPAPAQQMVSRVVNNLTPFHIAPAAPPTRPAPTTTPPVTSRPTTEPAERPTTEDDGVGGPGSGADDGMTSGGVAPGRPSPEPGEGARNEGGSGDERQSRGGAEDGSSGRGGGGENDRPGNPALPSAEGPSGGELGDG